MSAELYYGIQLTEEEFQTNCYENFIFNSSLVKTMKEWLELCDVFHYIQVKYSLDVNIIKKWLLDYLDEHPRPISVWISFDEITEGRLDKYGYSQFLENGYRAKYDFCSHLQVDNEYENEVGGVINNKDREYEHILGVKLISTDYDYSGKFSFDVEEILQMSCVIEFNKAIKAYSKLCKFKPKFIVVGDNKK